MNKPLSHKGKVLFIDAKDKVTRKNAESYLTPEHIEEIAKSYVKYENIEGFTSVVDNRTIENNDSMLSIPMYVKRINSDIYNISDSLEEYTKANCRMHNEYAELINILKI